MNEPEEPHELRLDLPAAHSAGRMARRMAREFALEKQVPEREVDTLEFVAGELLDNAVDHGGGGSAREEGDLEEDVRMFLLVRVAAGSWSVRVDDQGGGEPAELRPYVEPSDELPDLEDERGRGFFLMAQMVDRITVERSQDGLGLAIEAHRVHGPGA